MRRFLNRKYLIFAIIVLAAFFSAGVASSLRQGGASAKAVRSVAVDRSLPKFTASELKKYNGTDPSLPIYLVLDGNVYDVTKGSEFYKVGGPYHDLAGKDSSLLLHIVGGDIIKRKYPVIGTFVNFN